MIRQGLLSVLGIALLAVAGQAMERTKPPLRVDLTAHAAGDWPIQFAATVDGEVAWTPELVSCCLTDGTLSTVRISSHVRRNSDRPGFPLKVSWTEYHTGGSFAADVRIETADFPEWKGDAADLHLIFGPGGELSVAVPNADYAAARPALEPGQEITGEGLGEFLSDPGLGRPPRLSDLTILAEVCGTPLAARPDVLEEALRLLSDADRARADGQATGPRQSDRCGG